MLETGRPARVSGNTAAMVGEGGVSWLSPHFQVHRYTIFFLEFIVTLFRYYFIRLNSTAGSEGVKERLVHELEVLRKRRIGLCVKSVICTRALHLLPIRNAARVQYSVASRHTANIWCHQVLAVDATLF